MANHYGKWDGISADDEEQTPAPNLPEQKFSVPNIAEARQRAQSAKASGAAPNALDDLFTLGANASAADLMAKLKALPHGAKEQFLQGLQSQTGKELLQRAAYQKAEAKDAEAKPRTDELVHNIISGRPAPAPTAAAPASSDHASGSSLVGQRVRLSNLVSRPELNGRVGLCERFMADKGRCAVRLDGEGTDAPPLSLKPACLTRVE